MVLGFLVLALAAPLAAQPAGRALWEGADVCACAPAHRPANAAASAPRITMFMPILLEGRGVTGGSTPQAGIPQRA
jgi:hypothetical protein